MSSDLARPAESIADSETRSSSTGNPAGVRRAVILAAGRGSRLHAVTSEMPKCLVEIGGEILLERSLRVLASQGITEVVIVIGYKGEVIRDHIGSRFAGIGICYVEAPDFATTNNIRSLWDARHYLNEDLLLLEADIAFDPGVIAAMLAEVAGSAAAVAPFELALSGTVVRCDSQRCITSFTLGADQDSQFDHTDTFKTVNIYLLRGEMLRSQVVPRLTRAIEAGEVAGYYESVLSDCIGDRSVTDMLAVDVSASRWSEIDDDRDLDAAEFRFLDRDAQFDRVQQLHGAYWRYGFVDHSYL